MTRTTTHSVQPAAPRPAAAPKPAPAPKTKPAIVLGNGPTLPKPSELQALRACLTVGVNRILPACDPTVVMFVDGDVAAEVSAERAQHRDVMAVTVAPYTKHGDIQLEEVSGKRSWDVPLRAHQMHVNGNTGVAAARWLLSMGYSPIYMVGVSEVVKPGDKSGRSKQLAENMTKEVELLKKHHGAAVVFVEPDATMGQLATSARSCFSKEQLRDELRAAVETSRKRRF